MSDIHPEQFPGASGRSSAGAGSMDARDVLRGIWRRRYMVLALTLIAATCSILFVAFADKEYAATAQVLLENLETPFDRSQQQSDTERRLFDESEISSQVQVLRSRDLAKRVVNDLKLVGRPDFDPLSRGLSLPTRILIALGLRDDPRKQTPEQRALSSLSSKVRAYQISDSKVMEIEGLSGNPQTAADIANALAEGYVVSTREAQSDSTARARQWLSEQIEALRKEVVASEAAVETFRAGSDLLKGPTATLSTQELAELNTQIILAEAARSEAEAKVEAIRELLERTGTVDTSSAVINSPLIQRLREQQIVLRRTIAELSATYLENHPRIVSAKRELQDLDRQVRAEALKVVAGLEQDAKVAASREAALRQSLVTLKTRAGESGADEVKLRALEREATANRNLLESFLTKFSDASARQEVMAQPGIARIISRADPPSQPSFPKTGPIVLLGTLAGFTLGLGLAFMAEVMKGVGRDDFDARSRRIAVPIHVAPRAEPALERTSEPEIVSEPAPEPEPEPRLPFPAAAEESVPPTAALAAAPEPPPGQELPPTGAELPMPAAADPHGAQPMPSLCVASRSASFGDPVSVAADLDGPFAASLKPLVAWSASLRQTLGVRRFALVAGDDVGIDGAAAVMVLARSLAAQGVKTVLVDAAMQSDWIARIAGLGSKRGLRDLLLGKARFSDVIVKDRSSAVQILAAGAESPDLADATISSRMDRVLGALGEAYDVILMHVGRPLSEASERAAVVKCHAAVVFASTRHSGHTESLLAGLGDMGLSAVQVVRFADVASPARTTSKVTAGA